ncbi:hypothetical protein TcWFU_008194 [Taenia crassiceps]|uniref:Fibronectin type-III domain-containing protein n=1 Tax=Taenia crassiceps TaxID=6207 RepID=A0ABR4Q3S8_9CEST
MLSGGLKLLQPHFHWRPVGPHTIQLSWDIQQLVEHSVEVISVTARPTSNLDLFKHKTADVAIGQVLLDGLRPNTLYKVSLEAIRNTTSLFYGSRCIQTWPSAPSPVLPPTGRATSSTSIELEWCRLEASTVPADRQDAKECRAQSGLSSPIRTLSGNSKALPMHFQHWSRMGSQGIQIRWHCEDFAEPKPHHIQLSATPANRIGSDYQAKGDFLSGEITLEGLQSNTLYNLSLTGLGDKSASTYTYTGVIEIQPLDKQVGRIINTGQYQTGALPSPTQLTKETEDSVRSGGVVLTSAMFGILLAGALA